MEKMMKLVLVLGFAVSLTVCGGCSSDSDGGSEKAKVCAPGKTEQCACVGGVTTGAQTCEASGEAWGKCECAGAQVGVGGDGSRPSTACVPGTEESCQCGRCVGANGSRQCDAQGNWTTCAGPVCDVQPPECLN